MYDSIGVENVLDLRSDMGGMDDYDDPARPGQISLVPTATIFVQDDDARVLMVQPAESRQWSLPGGVMEVGETLPVCAERQTLERTGYQVKVVDIIGVYSGPQNMRELGDGEVRQEFVIGFRGLLVGDTTSSKIPGVGWVDPVSLDELPMDPSMRLRVHHGLKHLPHAYLG